MLFAAVGRAESPTGEVKTAFGCQGTKELAGATAASREGGQELPHLCSCQGIANQRLFFWVQRDTELPTLLS